MEQHASNRNIALEVHRYRSLREQLLSAFPEIDQDDFADTLEGITDLHEMIGEVIRSALADQAMVSGLKDRVEDMRLRLGRLDERGRKKRQLALDALVDADIRKLMQPDFTVSVRAGAPALTVICEDEIPEDFWRPQPPKLDRQAVLATLKQGREVSGASLNNPAPTLSVRTK